MGEGGGGEAKRFTRDIRRAVRAERRKRLLDMVSRELDEREYWMGLRQLKKGYTPIPYAFKDVRGRTVSMGARAEAAAEFLAERIWGLGDQVGAARESRIWEEDAPAREEELTVGEIRSVIRKLKRNKAAGPDGVPVDLFKEMGDENLADSRAVE